MKKRRILSPIDKIILTASLCCILAGVLTFAQSHGQWALSGNVPFEFVFDKKVFPAGAYRFVASRNTSGFSLLTISGSNGEKTTVRVMTKLGGSFDPGDARLVFDDVDSKNVLSEVWTSGEEGLLIQATAKEHTHRTVIVNVTGPTTKMSGNQIFEQTCQRCHGAKGRGNPAADSFFQTTIPRLNSEAILAKSDQDLKDVISHGRRNMPPVRIGQATVQHLLPPESVDAVIGYIRTFKK
jgi:cytochrome c5